MDSVSTVVNITAYGFIVSDFNNNVSKSDLSGSGFSITITTTTKKSETKCQPNKFFWMFVRSSGE